MCAKKNTRSRILSQAIELFNEKAWSQVSLRQIAAALNMSDGNLRYHFKTKEELVLDAFTAMTTEMAVEIEKGYEGMDVLQERFADMFAIMHTYRFLFTESFFIKKAYPSYAVLFNQLEESRRQLFMDEFNTLKEQGILSKEYSDEQYEMLFEQLFIISDNWIRYLEGAETDYVRNRIQHYAYLCYSLLVPYKT